MQPQKSNAGYSKSAAKFKLGDFGWLRNTLTANSRVDTTPSDGQVFHLLLIKPTRYDDEGYPIQWLRSSIPSNSLACMNGLALDVAQRKILGEDVEIRVSTFDEACDVIKIEELAQTLRDAGQRALVCMAGVQTNQFPRTVDVSKRFIQHGIPVCIGGFHVSGILSVIGELTDELLDAQKHGISLFAGEAESGRFDFVVKDAWDNSLQPLYDYQSDMVSLDEQPQPVLPKDLVKRNFNNISTIDLGRGCPFQCSFCCIINVQGRTSRSRSADDLEALARQAWDAGLEKIFITDDDFARNKYWEALFDRLILLREEGIKLRLFIQVDTQAHKIPNFIDKAVAAGVDNVFIGLENINADNLKSIQKRQNKITDYRQMLLDWKRHPVVIWGAYIIGFPNDTYESVIRDIEIIKRELPIDILNPSILTPLPGSMDHKDMMDKGEWMDPDLNKFDLSHRVTHHPKMTDEELDSLYKAVWDTYYTKEHMHRVIKRAFALGSNKKYTLSGLLTAFGVITKVTGIRSYDMGFIRYVARKERREGLPLEHPLVFYPKMYWRLIKSTLTISFAASSLARTARKMWLSKSFKGYIDEAITPVVVDDYESMEMYQQTRGVKEQADKAVAKIAAKEAKVFYREA
ncbi:hypothetical protein NBRC116188_19600 [Oceaniserpentilla sp. 4NH20-0058]|uniref:B12-binding domain-containing radical SAM protein n=1 Tax=Oceaniserpentilla sp. 4NH20-0058 TaxID=3127660 RepID=UPI003109CEA8